MLYVVSYYNSISTYMFFNFKIIKTKLIDVSLQYNKLLNLYSSMIE